MSLEIHIFLENSRVPTREVWQRAIDQIGFPLILDQSFDPSKSERFQPAFFKNQTTGFEFYLEPSDELLSVYSTIAQQVGSRDMCATFRWGSDLVEMSAALSAAAALTQLADGIYYFPNDELLYTANDVVEAIKKELNSV